MGKFRKKPVVIEAVQFLSYEHYQRGWPPPEGVQFHEKCEIENGACPFDGKYIIETLEGNHIVTEGDWIITGVAGERYPCKSEIFWATYEPVE